MKKLITLLSVLLLSIVLLCSCSASDSNYESNYGGDKPNSSDTGSETSDKLYSDKVIKNAYVNSETKEFGKALDDVKLLIAEYEGYIYFSNTSVESSYYNNGQQLRHADYTIKIPAEKFDAFLEALGNVLNVTRISTSTADASDEYYDLEATVNAYRDKRDGLLEMLKNVDNNTDFYTWQQINSQLTQLEIDLARYEAKFKDLKDQIAYSTVTLNISEVAELTPAEEVGFGGELLDAVKESLEGTVEFFKGLLIAMIYMLPFMLISGGIALMIVLLIRRGRRKRAARRAAAHEEKKD